MKLPVSNFILTLSCSPLFSHTQPTYDISFRLSDLTKDTNRNQRLHIQFPSILFSKITLHPPHTNHTYLRPTQSSITSTSTHLPVFSTTILSFSLLFPFTSPHTRTFHSNLFYTLSLLQSTSNSLVHPKINILVNEHEIIISVFKFNILRYVNTLSLILYADPVLDPCVAGPFFLPMAFNQPKSSPILYSQDDIYHPSHSRTLLLVMLPTLMPEIPGQNAFLFTLDRTICLSRRIRHRQQ